MNTKNNNTSIIIDKINQIIWEISNQVRNTDFKIHEHEHISVDQLHNSASYQSDPKLQIEQIIHIYKFKIEKKERKISVEFS